MARKPSPRTTLKATEFTAIESRAASRSALALFEQKFASRAEVIEWGGSRVLWQPVVKTWGLFSETRGKNNEARPWNAFGHEPSGFRQNIVVEINQPRTGIDTNLQSVFATDSAGKRWVLHQGRMSVPGVRIKQSDFMAATSLKPISVLFSNGERRAYHPVACLDDKPERVQADIADFVRACALVRLMAKIPSKLANALIRARTLESTLTPEKGGNYEIAPRGSTVGRRLHAEVWKALSKLLDHRGIENSNARILSFGPDLFTVREPFVLFEIKTRPGPDDVFKGIGQLEIYEQLLGFKFRKVLVVPKGMGMGLRRPIANLDIHHLEYGYEGRAVAIDGSGLTKVFKL